MKSFGARARARLASGVPPVVDSAGIDRFILRVGRPIPVVLALGGDVGALCAEFDRLGASAFGVDASDDALALARAHYPGGNLRRSDIRALDFVDSSFDGAWTGSVLCRMPRAQALGALREVHRVLRMGALLAVSLLNGEGEGLVATPHGPVYECRWDVAAFVAACDALDMLLLEKPPSVEGVNSLLFRREY